METIMMTNKLPEFQPWPKIYRYFRDVIVTEKIDGTNAQVYISEDLETVAAGSRTRWITPEQDNHGFAAWVEANKDELRKLGPGSHFGEWWGSGIQRGYGLPKGEKRFSLFNTYKWLDDKVRPKCCHVVPVLYEGPNCGVTIATVAEQLLDHGSHASPGFKNPEGIIIFNIAGNFCQKFTFGGDGHKEAAKERERLAKLKELS